MKKPVITALCCLLSLGTATAACPFANLTPPVSMPFFRRKQKTMLFRANYPL